MLVTHAWIPGRRFWLPLLLSVILSVPAGSTAPAAEKRGLRAAIESITATDLKRRVTVLADDAMEGREAGSRGGHAARAYLQRLLTQLGVAGGNGHGGYRQPFAAGYCNLLARIDGGDPRLKAEWIVVGAHYDHVGYGTRRNSFGPIGVVHNGADDNASGTSTVLELIEALRQVGNPPRRSILLAFWDAEEKGMLGSKYWVVHPTVPLKQVRIAITLDMVGRLRHNRLNVFGTRTSWGLRRRLSDATMGTDLQLDLPWTLKANSDHWPFVEHGVPSLLLHTGLHAQYHRPTDDADLINAQGMQQVTRFAFQLVEALVNADSLPRFRAAGRYETAASRRQLQQPLPPRPPRLGAAWSATDPSDHGVRLTRITPQSPAAVAGLRPGDQILAIDGQTIDRSTDLRTVVLQATGPVRLVVQRSTTDGNEPTRFERTVPLAGRPVRIGISWREDPANPGSVMLTRVVPGSAAARAGLRTGDRIDQVGGTNFRAGDFGQRLRHASGTVTLLIERAGRPRIVTLTLPPAPRHAPRDDSHPAGNDGGTPRRRGIAQ